MLLLHFKVESVLQKQAKQQLEDLNTKKRSASKQFHDFGSQHFKVRFSLKKSWKVMNIF